MLGDFARLGLGTPIGVSALNDRNIDQVVTRDPRERRPDERPDRDARRRRCIVAIVGKRNAGKSTLVNAIAELYEGDGDRVIVSEVPGTTRDSVDVRFEKDGKTLIVIDTAGVRKKRHMVTNDIEFYSFHRAQRSVRRADVVLMLIDATEPVSEPDKKLAEYIADEVKPVVLVVNKWDLAREADQGRAVPTTAEMPADSELTEKYRVYLDEELKHLDYAPIAFITAKEGRNVESLIDLCQHLYKQANLRDHDAQAERGGAADPDRAHAEHAGRPAAADLLRDADGRRAADDRAVREQGRVSGRIVPAVHGQPLPRAAAVRRGADPIARPRAVGAGSERHAGRPAVRVFAQEEDGKENDRAEEKAEPAGAEAQAEERAKKRPEARDATGLKDSRGCHPDGATGEPKDLALTPSPHVLGGRGLG